jgi:hypothetical protein
MDSASMTYALRVAESVSAMLLNAVVARSHRHHRGWPKAVWPVPSPASTEHQLFVAEIIELANIEVHVLRQQARDHFDISVGLFPPNPLDRLRAMFREIIGQCGDEVLAELVA